MKYLRLYSVLITVLLLIYHFSKFNKKNNAENKENGLTIVALIPVIVYLVNNI